MSSREFAEWMAYFRLEPFGEARADWRAAMLAALIANVNRDPKRGKPFRIADFMPEFNAESQREPSKTSAEMLAIFKSLTERPSPTAGEAPAPTAPPLPDGRGEEKA